MTIALEHLADASIADRNFQKLTRLVMDTGGQTAGIRFGATSVVFTAVATASTTVTHGLGKTPIVALATFDISGTAFHIMAEVFSVGATTFGLQGFLPAGAATTTRTAYWVVIG